MKAIALALMFAAVAVEATAQETKQTPREELAKAIAVEEQEHDLAKAETLYREALAGKKLSPAALALANQRLGTVLKRLGRDADAEPFLKAAGADTGAVVTLDDVTSGLVQDVGREKALREKAREIVQEVFEPGDPDGRKIEQLTWIGEPAIPAIAAALTGKSANVNTLDGQVFARLAGLLWYFGTPAAESHLEALLRAGDAEMRRCLVADAAQLRDPRMLRFAERWLQQEKDEEVAMQLLTSSNSEAHGGALAVRLDPEVVIDDAARRSPNERIWVLGALAPRELPRPALAKAHALVRASLAGADPDLGQAAQRFLASRWSQVSPEGVELLLQQLPRFRNGSSPEDPGLPSEWLLPKPAPDRAAPIRPEAAAHLWPQLVACANALPADSSCRRWLGNRVSTCAQALGAEIAPDLVALIERGCGDVGMLQGKVNLANARQVFNLYDVPSLGAGRATLLQILGSSDLPPELFEPLRDRAAARMAADPSDNAGSFAMPIATTGHPDAAAWLLAFLKRGAERTAVQGLLELGRRSQDEKVRAAMREAVGVVKPTGWHSVLLLALLSMSDAPTLDLVVDTAASAGSASHPYARNEKPEQVTPLEYLLYASDPPHGIAEDAVARVLTRVAKARMPGVGLAADPSRVSDRLLIEGVLAGIGETWVTRGNSRTQVSWRETLAKRIQREKPPAALHAWFDDTLRTRGPGKSLLSLLDAEEVARVRPQLDSYLAGDDGDVARLAFDALDRTNQPLDFDALMQSKHESVRAAAFWLALERGQLSNEAAIRAIAKGRGNDRIAQYLGSRVAVEAVPALIGLLKDPIDGVRTAAAEALTRIRFHHEQQAYWDRIVKGLDASPASAAEKLLLQAKPGAAKAQRLLAIQSLGTLGLPEALPFLIDWTQDADGEIAKAAKDAITQIHLNPRR